MQLVCKGSSLILVALLACTLGWTSGLVRADPPPPTASKIDFEFDPHFPTVIRNLRMQPGATDDDMELLRHIDSVESIQLYSNQITDAGLAHLRSLPNLTFLSIKTEYVTAAGFAETAHNRQLEGIFIHKTPIDLAGLEHLSSLSHLQSLVFGNVEITGGMVWLMANRMPGIKELHIAACELDDDDILELSKLRDLTILELKRTDTSPAGLQHLKHYKSLRVLRLGGDNYGQKGLQEISKCLYLRELKLHDVGIRDDDDLVCLGSLRWLESLAVTSGSYPSGRNGPRRISAETNFAGNGVVALASNFEHLKQLDLRGTDIDDDCEAQLATMKQLKRLDVSVTKLSAACVERLRKALQNTEIVYENDPAD